jgi:hypothetical protein
VPVLPAPLGLGGPGAPGDPPDAILPLTKVPGWREVDPPPDFWTWTDDYSNVVRVLATR